MSAIDRQLWRKYKRYVMATRIRYEDSRIVFCTSRFYFIIWMVACLGAFVGFDKLASLAGVALPVLVSDLLFVGFGFVGAALWWHRNRQLGYVLTVLDEGTGARREIWSRRLGASSISAFRIQRIASGEYGRCSVLVAVLANGDETPVWHWPRGTGAERRLAEFGQEIDRRFGLELFDGPATSAV